MEYYIALDGGGTKLQGILFDETYHLIAVARSGGINRNVHTEEAAMRHTSECVDSLFASAEAQGIRISRIHRVLLSWGGVYKEKITCYCPVDEVVLCGEGVVGVLCCGMSTGLLALSGTGSDVFLIQNGQWVDAIGGWGYLLGDDGSGTWIGRKAIRSMLRVLEKTSPEESRIHSLIREKYHPEKPNDLVEYILCSPAPGQQIGSFCKIVNAAAQQGDAIACQILHDAGRVLAEDVLRMKKKHSLPEQFDICTAGSVFQYCSEMSRSFSEQLLRDWPTARVHRALFQPVIGCVIYDMLRTGHVLDKKTIQFLENEYAAFRI